MEWAGALPMLICPVVEETLRPVPGGTIQFAPIFIALLLDDTIGQIEKSYFSPHTVNINASLRSDAL
jgi:hypothetical protein